jgi:hypothetical protein
MDWKSDLDKKFNQVKKEEKNHVHIGSDSNIGSGSSPVCRIPLVEKTRQSINERSNKSMITVEGALSDLDVLINEATDGNTKALLKGVKVLVKFLSTIRSNQLLTDADKAAIRAKKAERPARETK